MIHLYAVFRRIFKLTRTCPKCKRDQVAKPSQKTESIPCKFCGTSISPPRGK